MDHSPLLAPTEWAGSPPGVIVWGTGSIGRRHLRVLRDHLSLVPMALPARPKTVLDGDLADVRVIRDLGEGWSRGARAVIVATDTARHVEDTLTAIRAGFDVLVEKPMSVDAEKARLVLRSGLSSARVRVGYCLRFKASLAAFRQALPEIGSVHHVSIACQSYLPDWRTERDHREGYSARADEGGVLRDLSHDIDYCRWLFGSPASVLGLLSSTGKLGIESEESADLLWRANDAAVVSIRLDYLTRHARRTMVAYGELGELRWDAIADRVHLVLHDKSAQVVFSESEHRDATLASQDRAFLLGTSSAQWDSLATVDDGVHVLAICDAARLSSDTGRTQTVVA